MYLHRGKTAGIAQKWLPSLQDVRFRGAGWNSCESRRSEKQQQHSWRSSRQARPARPLGGHNLIPGSARVFGCTRYMYVCMCTKNPENSGSG
eukprot:COSAG01_NODE_2437_length_7694_cov_47.587887_2_plen_92_part_00